MAGRELQRRDTAHRCGQLYASVWALEQLAKSGNRHRPPDDKALASVGAAPEKRMREDLSAIGKYLREAMESGSSRRKAAEDIYHEIGTLMREIVQASRKVPNYLDRPGVQRFIAGFKDQLAEYHEAHGSYF